MSEKQIKALSDGIEPAYRKLFNQIGRQAEAAYLKGGKNAMTKAIHDSRLPLRNLLAKNYVGSTAFGVSSMKLRRITKARRPANKTFVDPRVDPDFAARIAANYVKMHANDKSDKITNTTLDLARQAVAAGIEAEKTPGQIALLIRATVGEDVGAYRARMIARTETAGAYNSATHDTAEEMQASTGPLNKVWIAASDDRVRETHSDVDGTSIPLGEDFTVGESKMGFPSDPSGEASEVINCRCTLVYEPAE